MLQNSNVDSSITLPLVQPLERVVNGFRLVPKLSIYKYWFWTIKPQNSNCTFCFNSLSRATDFAKHYINNHSSSFWCRLWVDFPLFHEKQVVSTLTELSYCC